LVEPRREAGMSKSTSPKRRKHSKLQQAPRLPRCPETGKNAFRNEKRALTALNYNRANGGDAVSVYKCPHCNDWHLTKLGRAA
jgi:hypothetical protein